ncbi:hypothetical protein V3C33_17970 [Micrococcaceae bacterium Sec5.7]
MAGIVAMILAALLGTVMGLNNTAVVMSSCVVYVAVAMWADSRITRHRRDAAVLQQARQAASMGPQQPAASLERGLETMRPVQRQLPQEETSKHEGNAA